MGRPFSREPSGSCNGCPPPPRSATVKLVLLAVGCLLVTAAILIAPHLFINWRNG